MKSDPRKDMGRKGPPARVRCECGVELARLAPGERLTRSGGELREVVCGCGREVKLRVEAEGAG